MDSQILMFITQEALSFVSYLFEILIVSSALQGLPDTGKVTIFAGILLNNLDIALRMADVGPSADNKKEVMV